MQRNLAERIDCHDNLLNISNFYRSLFWGQNFGIHDQGLNLEETKSMSKTLQHTVMVFNFKPKRKEIRNLGRGKEDFRTL